MAALTRMAVIGAAVLGVAAGAGEAWGQTGAVSLSGFDIKNRTGGTVHSFSARYSRLSVDAFLELDDGSFANADVSEVRGGGVYVSWTKGAIEPGQLVHVGFSLDESPPQRQAVVPGGFQFDPGTPPLAAATAQKWESAGNGRWRDVATGECCFVNVSRSVATTDLELTLDDMQPAGALRLLASPVDPGPVPIPDGGELTFDYPQVPPNVWCIMIYDVYDMGTGEVVMSFCNAVRGRPCPADWDGNGVVNSTDVSNFINSWFASLDAGTLEADWDENGVVNSTDVSNFINDWFEDVADGCG